MSIGLSDLKSLLRLCFMPNVLVLETDTVREVCRRTFGSCLADCLTQSVLGEIARSHNSQQATADVRYRFISEEQAEGMSPAEQTAFLKESISAVSAGTYTGVSLRWLKDVEAFKKAYPDPAPWYFLFRWLYIHTLGCNQYDSTFHPVACMVVVSAHQDGPPLAAFRRLWPPQHLPPFFAGRPHVDPHIRRFYVLLQHQEVPQKTIDTMLRELHSAYGSNNVLLLRIFTAPLPAPTTPSPPTSDPSLSPECNKPITGAVLLQQKPRFSILHPLAANSELTPGDVAELDKLVFAVTQHTTRYLRELMTELSQQIAELRQTLSNRVKNLFKRDSSPPISAVPVEFLIRRLGDLCVVMRDYDTAIKTYTQFSVDQKNDKAVPYFAATREMLGICTFMTDGRDAESLLSQAVSLYQRCNEVPLAIRAIIIHGGVLSYHKQHKAACEVYLTATDYLTADTDQFTAALLVEQAALCHLLLTPASVRKFCFWFVTAGSRFGAVGQAGHAVRCYSLAQGMYAGRHWQMIDDHVNLALARFSFELGDVTTALAYTRASLLTNALPPADQSSLLRQYLHVIKCKVGSTEHVPELDLPLVRRKSVYVVQDEYSAMLGAWEGFRKKRSPLSVPPACPVHEEVIVQMELRNPVAVPLQLEHVQLLLAQEDINFESGTSAVLLCPSESKQIALSFTPLREGPLAVNGIAFSLCGTWFRLTFSRRSLRNPPPLYSALCPPASPACSPSPNANSGRPAVSDVPCALRVQVVLPAPHLRLLLDGFPAAMCDGTVVRVGLHLHNDSSQVRASNLRFRFSHPRFFAAVHGQQQQQTEIYAGPWLVVPESVAPGEEITLPFFLRPTIETPATVDYALQVTVQYEHEDAPLGAQLVCRRAVANATLHVIPSLSLAHTLLPSSLTSDASLLLLKVANVHPTQTVRPLSLTCVREDWTLVRTSFRYPAQIEPGVRPAPLHFSHPEPTTPGGCESLLPVHNSRRLGK
eukprot:TRINITY_DN1063_c0_g1_i3.p1 TRINITY_DN1063_c0_g1~~TRINITY_DN1063_c0_g1_i3.p1  ORF type:complete len:997 (-),score=150.94 TRINITY_DN1063_c0_g1_i3:715-3663(-)